MGFLIVLLYFIVTILTYIYFSEEYGNLVFGKIKARLKFAIELVIVTVFYIAINVLFIAKALEIL